jgi:hypothetical protein
MPCCRAEGCCRGLLRRRECLVLLLVVVKRYVVKKNLVCAAQHTSFHVLRKEQYVLYVA